MRTVNWPREFERLSEMLTAEKKKVAQLEYDLEKVRFVVKFLQEEYMPKPKQYESTNPPPSLL
jgi:hypothetical protein